MKYVYMCVVYMKVGSGEEETGILVLLSLQGRDEGKKRLPHIVNSKEE